MGTLEIFLLSVPVGLLITWRLLTGSARQHRSERRASESTTGGDRYARKKNIGLPHAQYEAKRLRICNRPCRAALQLRGQAFLAGGAPSLPLPECDRKDGCYCKYSTHEDRRAGRDRRFPVEDIVASDNLLLPDSAVLAEERRTQDDRRKP